ncbi:MAG: YhfC family intramembrane metalloprotease [archaeon]|nr:YhfC family intramembrane metalloprotease [archaeon]MCP8321466.1 YhfC family intramembrane metalloprotease [archaeon]
MAFDLQIPNWVAILIALVPAFAVFIYFSRAKGSMWLAFIVGGVGWLGALLLRLLPLQLPLVIYGQDFASSLVYFGYASLLAGLFEEGIRYICIKKASFTREDHRHVLSFGLGWGFLEAVLMYALSVLVVLVLMPELTFMEFLPGAIERNTAVLLHSAMSFLVLCALSMKRFLILAIGLHAIVDMIAVSIYYYVFIGEVWLVEGILFAMTLLVAVFTYLIVKRYSPIRG